MWKRLSRACDFRGWNRRQPRFETLKAMSQGADLSMRSPERPLPAPADDCARRPPEHREEPMEPLQPGEKEQYRQWVRVRSRLEAALGKQSRLPAPLAAYAIDHAGHMRLSAVKVLRDEYGIPSDPTAEELMPLLDIE